MNSRKFADNVMPFLEKYNSYTDKEKILAHYGLETIYILVTKLILVTIISLFLHITKEMYIFLFFYGILRSYAGGVHLSTSIGCSLVSSVLFIGFPELCIHTNIYIGYRIIIIGLSIIIFAFYSPADTKRKPIIREEKRIYKKKMTLLFCFIYSIMILILKNNFLLNVLTYSLLLQSYVITPFAYKIFNQTYNNYLIYENMNKRR